MLQFVGLHRSICILSAVSCTLLSTASASRDVLAQVIPDQTLPTGEQSRVSGNAAVQIDGGAQRGGNLFHSFSQFSVPTGNSVFFNNGTDVQRIFTRVTGGAVSTIDGLIRANGSADLFLLNPNGILFGPNARLNIGGSFVASTADHITLADGALFSAKAPQTTPLLTMSVPVGLQMGQNPGNIRAQGKGYELSAPIPVFLPLVRGTGSTGLQVASGKTLALIGSDLALEGGTLTAEQGRIELGSVRDGQVSLQSTANGLSFSYGNIHRFGGIRLSQQALADASGSPGGEIQLQGNNISLTDGSLILIQTLGSQPAGKIVINAESSLNMSGDSPDGSFSGGLSSETLTNGRGADIVVSTRQLVLEKGAAISTISYGTAEAGNVAVSSSDWVQVIGFLPTYRPLNSRIVTYALNSGDAGNVDVASGQLTVLNGAAVGSQVVGAGDSGDVTINATELVEVVGASSQTVSNVAAVTAGTGDAGKITINTSRVALRNGGAISTSTGASGNAGSVTINATESVDISGGTLLDSPLGPSSFPIPSFINASAEFYGVLDPAPSGISGDVTIVTGKLKVTDGALVTVSNQGTGNAGTLTVRANSIVLDNRGRITAATVSGDGGNINLQLRDGVLLRRGSQITTSAGGTGNGGNITLNAGAITAVPNENSDILANSVNARGGNVVINASGVFGIQFRPQVTPQSDITATGANSALNGTVQLNIERTDFSREFVQLTDLVDVSGLIAQGCQDVRGSSFVVTGRGGLPPTPEQPVSNDPLWQDLRDLPVGSSSAIAPQTSPSTSVKNLVDTSTTPRSSIVEANGWEVDEHGVVTLTATIPAVRPNESLKQAVNCHER